MCAFGQAHPHNPKRGGFGFCNMVFFWFRSVMVLLGTCNSQLEQMSKAEELTVVQSADKTWAFAERVFLKKIRGGSLTNFVQVAVAVQLDSSVGAGLHSGGVPQQPCGILQGRRLAGEGAGAHTSTIPEER